MLDPTATGLAALAAQSAAKAVGGMAVRASAPAWRSAAGKLLPAPAEVRRSASWSELKLAAKHHDAIAGYLGGRLCTGLLELLAFLELAERTARRDEEKDQLAATFRRELVSRLDLPEDRAAAIGDAVWAELHDCVRLSVRELREAGAFADEDLVYAARLVRRPTETADGPQLVKSVVERSTASVSVDRVRAAHTAVRVIREAMRERYAKLVMPHSREDYRVPIEQIYVTRTLAPRDFDRRLGASERGEPRRLDDTPVPEADLADRRFVVVGNPGAGKSTFIRHLLYELGRQGEEHGQQAPMVIELKDHQAPDHSYTSVLADRLRVVTQAELDVETVRDVLLLGLATVVFDGLDEISDLDQRRSTIDAIEAFCRRFPLVRVVVTSREEGYVSARLDPQLFPVYRIPDFTDEQVETYVRRWFELVSGPRMFEPGERRDTFLADSVHVGDLRTNPLMLSLLCMLYEYEGYIPENRPQVYEDCAELLFERWDRVRRVPLSFRANTQTRYLVQELAYYFFYRLDSQGGETEKKLRALVSDYFERSIVGGATAAREHAQDFLDYCAGRAWLLTQTGVSERGERLFGFTHRTFMEYFAACYIVRHCARPQELVNMVRPMIESGGSEVVPQIAIQQLDTRLASAIDDCLDLLVFDRTSHAEGQGRVSLEFALRSLRFMRPAPRTLTRLYTATLHAFAETWDLSLLDKLLGAPADTHDLIRATCRRVRGEASPLEGHGRAVRAAATIVLIVLDRPDRPAMTSLSGTMFRLVQEGLREVVQSDPDVVNEMYRNEFLSLDLYVTLMGARALVSQRFTTNAQTRVEVPGPLVHRLTAFFLTGEQDEHLPGMLAAVAEAPDAVVPMNGAVVEALLGVAERFSTRVIRGVYPLEDTEIGPDTLGFYRLFLAAMCAGYETGGPWRRVAEGLPVLREAVAEVAKRSRTTREVDIGRRALGTCVGQVLGRAGAAPQWDAVFEEWALGTRRITQD
ncbi:NACHT domain-containing protein [Solihabitans fulvus]|uniref:NACHT domain-containing protein n=1 Tax=Solihabitans fulvus TaxID=1892852 RepID=UPI001661A230|nr:NACHT domain-containing protein [Solihabitans fulvus]